MLDYYITDPVEKRQPQHRLSDPFLSFRLDHHANSVPVSTPVAPLLVQQYLRQIAKGTHWFLSRFSS